MCTVFDTNLIYWPVVMGARCCFLGAESLLLGHWRHQSWCRGSGSELEGQPCARLRRTRWLRPMIRSEPSFQEDWSREVHCIQQTINSFSTEFLHCFIGYLNLLTNSHEKLQLLTQNQVFFTASTACTGATTLSYLVQCDSTSTE